MKNRASKRESILETAKTFFSQKGYDATSMDEIALQVGVPKSLIYYHFKSKEKLLNAIMQKFFDDFELLMRDKIGAEAGADKKFFTDKEFFNFLQDNNDLIRIILIESLKKDNKNFSIFDIVKPLLQLNSEISNDHRLLNYHESHSRWVTKFFISVLPCALFVCFKDGWCSHFDTDETELFQDFSEAFRLTQPCHTSIKN